MRFNIFRNETLIAIMIILFGIGGIVLCINAKIGFDIYAIILYVFFSLIIISSVVLLIINNSKYIEIDETAVKFFIGRKRRKYIALKNIQRLIIVQFLFHGVKNHSIIFDDGTFYNKKRDKKDLYTKKTIEEESWIAIEYTDKRFEKIRQVLPNCPTVIKEAE